jgi:S-adenosylmethionine-diacylglycerol 3-amino-3-carboxypropyl transferase
MIKIGPFVIDHGASQWAQPLLGFLFRQQPPGDVLPSSAAALLSSQWWPAGLDPATPLGAASIVAGIALAAGVAVFVKRRVFPNMIDAICNRTYIYNICWEDPAVDLEILKIQPDDVLFRICSAGDVPLDYAIEGPAKIVVCDMNPHQLWLFELKVMMLRDPALTYDEWWGVWGSSDVQAAMRVWKRMRHTMSKGGREWWDGRIERVFRNGYATSGSAGWAASRVLLPGLCYVVGLDVKEWASTGFSHAYMAEKQDALQRAAWWFRHVFPGWLAPFAGVPPNQIGPEFYTTEFYESMLRAVFLDPDFGSTNYFYRFYYERGYKDQSCCPRTLKPEHFDALRRNAGCFEWHYASVQETMERVKPMTFTKLVLLDHMDWVRARLRASLEGN